jgi:hypothetical protein
VSWDVPPDSSIRNSPKLISVLIDRFTVLSLIRAFSDKMVSRPVVISGVIGDGEQHHEVVPGSHRILPDICHDRDTHCSSSSKMSWNFSGPSSLMVLRAPT